MKRSEERIEHHDCPESVKVRLILAGGVNPFGEPNFRLSWGYNRIVKIHGQWEEWEPARPTGIAGPDGRPIVIPPRCKGSVIETREVPKYLPGNCWHLEHWQSPESYGSPETWGKLGQEVIGCMTVDTAGPYPSRGDWELVFPMTSDGSPQGQPIPLEASCVEAIIAMLQKSKDFSMAMRIAAIKQRMEREEREKDARLIDVLSSGLPAFHGREFVTLN